MRRIYTLIIIGFISFSGFTVRAQPPTGSSDSIESMLQSLTSGSSSSEIPTTDVGVSRQGVEASTEPQTPIIEAPLVVDTVVPEVNRTTAEVIDSRTGRYPPRLKIDFTECPLRTFTSTNRTGHGLSAEAGTPTDIVVQRIQSRIRVPHIRLVVQDRTAIVSGTVATERQRSLIGSMLRFEPGIDTIQNDITIVP